MAMRGKKAQVFILSAIALIILFSITYSIYTSISEKSSINTRVRTMDSFIFSMEKDLERQLYTSGFRVLFLTQDKIARTGSYVSDFDDFFYEAMINGSVDGEESEIMQGATIQELIEQIKLRGSKMNILIDISDVNVSFGQDDPWHVFISIDAVFNITDKSQLASWNKRAVVKSYIEIDNFEDPLYFVSTNGRVSQKITKTIYEDADFVDRSNLLSHLENRYYSANTNAPSFLDRIKGINSASENGIESFVYIPELSAQSVQIREKSVVDYIYFSSFNPPYSSVSEMPSWFFIDDARKEKYGIS